MTETSVREPRTSGPGRTLIAFYGVMTLAALVRSLVQMIGELPAAPVAILLSFVSGVVYLVATIALAPDGSLVGLARITGGTATVLLNLPASEGAAA